MKIFIRNLYGFKDSRKAYYRKQGVYAFDFVSDESLASDLSADEAFKILEDADFYKYQYGADKIGIEC